MEGVDENVAVIKGIKQINKNNAFSVCSEHLKDSLPFGQAELL